MLLCLTALVLALFWWWLMSRARYRVPLNKATTRVQGYLWEVLLYGAYPKVLLRALAALSRACLALSWSLLRPSLWFSLPLLFALTLLSHNYGERPVRVGESFLLAVNLAPGESTESWTLRAPSELSVEVDGFRTSRALHWRLRAQQEGQYDLVLQSGGRSLSKTVKVGENMTYLNGARQRLGWQWLLAPTEAPIPRIFEVTTIAVDYPQRLLGWRGWHTPWPLLLLLAFAAWSWLLTLVRVPGNATSRRQTPAP